MSDSIKQEPIIATPFFFTLNFLPRKGSKPNTRVSCVRTEPMESPTLMFACPIDEDMIELMISGKSVPKDTNVNPIINGEIPRDEASETECLTALSLEKAIIRIPKANIIIATINSNIIIHLKF